MSYFTLPDLGEGLLEVEIAEWFIKEGDTVNVDQVIVAVETAKALVDIPSPEAGVVSRLYGDVGDIIHTGDPLLEFATENEAVTGTVIGTTNKAVKESSQHPGDQGSVVGEMPVNNVVHSEQAKSVGGTGLSSLGIKATPAVRALARRLDVDISVITPTGPNGTVSSTDVERVSKILSEVGKLQALKGVRRAMAITLSKAHAEVVPVTLNEDADIHLWAKSQDITARLIRAMVIACEKEPALNAWYDSHSIGRRLIKQVHIGIAVDSKEGLFVPVIRDVDKLTAIALRDSINNMKEAIHKRSVSPEALRGHTITLSNFGAMGGRYANPVVVPPTVAILGAGSAREEVKAVNGEISVRRCLPLSLTFDHRAVTGGEGCRFLMAVINDLEHEV
ncbi:MAG: 2-oxo acid dehydrogenase subunit E2 [Ectothiorhodospiraceae bacterium]|nr:2-oxo acid dehydrogenase subunit E2 [Ectothiorhodospiraceae bacterium]